MNKSYTRLWAFLIHYSYILFDTSSLIGWYSSSRSLVASLEARGKRGFSSAPPPCSLLGRCWGDGCWKMRELTDAPIPGMLSLALADQRLVPDQRCLHSLTALNTMEESVVSYTPRAIYLVCRTEGYRLKNIVYLMKPKFQIKPFA